MPKMITDTEVKVENGALKFFDSSQSSWNALRMGNTSELSCTELGWDIGYGTSDSAGCGNVVDIDGVATGCSQGAITWAQAKAACRTVGGRLPTKQEVLDLHVKGTGCSHDDRMVWTSTPGQEANSYALVCGDPDNADTNTQERLFDDVDFSANPLPSPTNEIGIRCVADS